MDILNSAWFLGMIKKAALTPRERLLAMFDILGDWLDAPHMRDQLSHSQLDIEQPQALLEYLTAQAIASGAQDPDTLAQQLYFMTTSMLQQELHSPGCAASKHAHQVAQALIKAQTEKDRSISKRSAYAMAASVFLITSISSLLLLGVTKTPGTSISPNIRAVNNTITAESNIASPMQTAAMLSTIEQMRTGVCQYPEALMIPESQQSVYMHDVVGGQVSDKIEDQALANKLMQKVRCNYTPMLMKNSTG